MDYSNYYRIEGEMVTCISPTPERETFTSTSYNIQSLRDEGKLDNYIKSLKNLVVQKLISPTFSEIIIHSTKAA